VTKKRVVSRVTKHGKPFDRKVPAESTWAELIGTMEGKLSITGDIFSTGIKWEAMQPIGEAGFREQSGG
jgi:hypothetical protein